MQWTASYERTVEFHPAYSIMTLSEQLEWDSNSSSHACLVTSDPHTYIYIYDITDKYKVMVKKAGNHQ
jgi:hypothetical protein